MMDLNPIYKSKNFKRFVIIFNYKSLWAK
jgi:hypothetical protein